IADAGSWDEILDALDVLGHAMHGAHDPAVLAGLRGVEERLEHFLARAGIVRHGAAGARPDGRLWRVVGSEPRPDLPAGVVARAARNLRLEHPGRAIRSAKRKMGQAHRYRVGTREVSPEEVSAEVLRVLRRGAEEATGEPVRDVVITVPAYFDDAQRRATLRA